MVGGSGLPRPGDIVADKYRIDCLIGRGGMGAVFGAIHVVTGKRFALKWLLSDGDTTSAESARRFIREAQVAGLFQHPNVVEVYDVGEVAGSFYMVMEWLTGESLADRLARVGRMSFEEVCALLIPCMRGVEDAHAAGIVHRDLKPANILVCRATKHAPEFAKVLDFGIAKLTSEVTRVTKSGVLVGTPQSMAPEQLRSAPIDRRTDVYAFGVMLYELLSGELPFTSDSIGELVLQICSGTPRPLREVVPGLAPEIEQVVMRAMAREPADRFQNLNELVAALSSVADEVHRIARASDVGGIAASLRYTPATARPPLPASQPGAASPAAYAPTAPLHAIDHAVAPAAHRATPLVGLQLPPARPSLPVRGRRVSYFLFGLALAAAVGWTLFRVSSGRGPFAGGDNRPAQGPPPTAAAAEPTTVSPHTSVAAATEAPVEPSAIPRGVDVAPPTAAVPNAAGTKSSAAPVLAPAKPKSRRLLPPLAAGTAQPPEIQSVPPEASAQPRPVGETPSGPNIGKNPLRMRLR